MFSYRPCCTLERLSVPIDPLRGAHEVEFFLTNTGARLLIFARHVGLRLPLVRWPPVLPESVSREHA